MMDGYVLEMPGTTVLPIDGLRVKLVWTVALSFSDLPECSLLLDLSFPQVVRRDWGGGGEVISVQDPVCTLCCVQSSE